MLAKMLYGYKMTQCLYVATKLNIADHLSLGKKSAQELAILTNANADALYRVMRCLATLGVFNEEQGKVFSLNDEAEELLTNSKNTMKDFIILCGEELYNAAGELLYSVSTGQPAFNHIYGQSHWEFLDKYPDKAAIFHNAMERGTSPMIQEIISHYDFSSFKDIVDIGGGKGQLVCEMLQINPEAHGITYDLLNAESSALDFVASSELSDRCDVVSGDFFKSIPSGDLLLLKVILHDWDDENAKLILKNCRDSIAANGKILIIEKVINDDKFKELACLGDINMLVMFAGKERSLIEFQELLKKSGFKYLRKIDTKTVFSIIEAEPAI